MTTEFKSNESIKIKVVFGDVIRLFRGQFSNGAAAFEAVNQFVSDNFAIKNFVLQYKDEEEDYVTMTNDSDFIDALDLATVQNKFPRIFVKQVSKKIESAGKKRARKSSKEKNSSCPIVSNLKSATEKKGCDREEEEAKQQPFSSPLCDLVSKVFKSMKENPTYKRQISDYLQTLLVLFQQGRRDFQAMMTETKKHYSELKNDDNLNLMIEHLCNLLDVAPHFRYIMEPLLGSLTTVQVDTAVNRICEKEVSQLPFGFLMSLLCSNDQDHHHHHHQPHFPPFWGGHYGPGMCKGGYRGGMWRGGRRGRRRGRQCWMQAKAPMAPSVNELGAVSKDGTDLKCVCGAPLVCLTAEEAYGGQCEVSCDGCGWTIGKETQQVWHCVKGKAEAKHPSGFDLCMSCYCKRMFVEPEVSPKGKEEGEEEEEEELGKKKKKEQQEEEEVVVKKEEEEEKGKEVIVEKEEKRLEPVVIIEEEEEEEEVEKKEDIEMEISDNEEDLEKDKVKEEEEEEKEPKKEENVKNEEVEVEKESVKKETMYEKELAELKSMGFQGDEFLLLMLEQHQGNVQDTVNYIC